MTIQSVMPASLWSATACKAPDYQAVSSDRSTEVAIVGGGYTGLSTALHLARSGVDVTLVEASEPGWGASGRNGGQIISGLKYEPDLLEARFGPRLGSAMVETMGASGALVRSIIENYGIDCHAQFNGWVQAAHGARAMRNTVLPRAQQWAARGVVTQVLDQRQVAELIGCPEDLYVGGWFDPRGGVLQPLSYARGLAAAAIREGAIVHALTPVRKLRQHGSRWILDLGRAQLTADKVILAANAYTDDLWPGLRQTLVPVTSFQIATYPLSKSLLEGVIPGGQGITDTRRLLNYYRLDHEGRLVIGGRCPVDDSPSMSDAASLISTLSKIFPQAAGAPVQFLWSGKVAITKDSLPHIHMLEPGLFAALGCNGRGVAVCTAIGSVLSEFVRGVPGGDIALPVTAPDRFAMHAFRKVGVMAASHYYRLLDRLESR